MLNLGFPLAVSFFCRMGMASTDSSFVGHIHNGQHSPETYLAAAVLSDMVLNICITPPLAFNQVLNALVGQAMGSNNPAMAGIWLQQSMFWLTVTMLPCLTGLFYVEPILTALGFPQDIASVAGTYAKFNLIWPIPNGLYQCLRFYFQARGLPRPAMYNNLLFLGINAMLNWIFVFGGPTSWKGLGFIGAAVSLSISRTLQGVCYYLYMFSYKQHHLAAWPEHGWSVRHHTRDRTMEFLKQSIPNLGTLLFSAFASQATTVLMGRLGERSIAASSALSAITMPWSGTLSATCVTVSGVRVGYHLGRGDAVAAKRASWLVMQFITIVNALMAVVFLVPSFKNKILDIATDDEDVVSLAETLIPAMLVGTYLNLMVGNGTSGIFSGQGRPLIATILSFGLELPLSIGGVAVYILVFHGNLLGVYWFNALAGALEAAIVLYLIVSSNWSLCAEEAQQRQEAARRSISVESENDDSNHGGTDLEDGRFSTAATDPESSSSDNDEEVIPLTGATDHTYVVDKQNL
jgi:MATE family multidrug resistance protein